MAPRVTVSNGLMIGMYDDLGNWNRAEALGVANYGQMTAGGWMYIGPQGIVHGTYSTLLNAARKELGVANDGDLSGVLFITSGLGGMSGAQPKAIEIAGGVGIIAEVDYSRIQTRHSQGWVSKITSDIQAAFDIATDAVKHKKPLSIAYHGNIVDLLEYAAANEISIPMLSDQTSCHNVYDGGYCPAGMTFEERTRVLGTDKEKFRAEVDKTLKRHYHAIKKLVNNHAIKKLVNIKDGSNIMADMATQIYAGNAARGRSLVALHNGGGVGIGKSINGGFGMVLDGSERVDTILSMAIPWDVMGGVARRAWARNDHALEACIEYNSNQRMNSHVTLPYIADDEMVAVLVKKRYSAR